MSPRRRRRHLLLLLLLFATTVFTTASVFQGEVAIGSTGSKDSKEEFFTPEVVIAIIVPLVTAMTWLGKDYFSKNQELSREQFRGEIIAAFATTLEETRKEYEEVINVKLQPMQHLTEKIADNISTSVASEKVLQENFEQLREHLFDMRVRIKVVESTLDSMVDTLNAELSAVLTAYLKDPIKVKLFTHEDNHLHSYKHRKE